MPLEIGREPRLHHPDVALVREHDALRHAGRARGVEEHRGLTRLGDHRFEFARIDEAVEACAILVAEHHGRQALRTVLQACVIAEHELCAGIADDEIDGLLRKPVIHRHSDQARAHDAEIGGDELDAVGRQDGDAITAGKAALGKAARDSHRHRIELGIAVFTRRLLAAEVNDRELGHVAVSTDQIAEVLEFRHQGSSELQIGRERDHIVVGELGDHLFHQLNPWARAIAGLHVVELAKHVLCGTLGDAWDLAQTLQRRPMTDRASDRLAVATGRPPLTRLPFGT